MDPHIARVPLPSPPGARRKIVVPSPCGPARCPLVLRGLWAWLRCLLGFLAGGAGHCNSLAPSAPCAKSLPPLEGGRGGRRSFPLEGCVVPASPFATERLSQNHSLPRGPLDASDARPAFKNSTGSEAEAELGSPRTPGWPASREERRGVPGDGIAGPQWSRAACWGHTRVGQGSPRLEACCGLRSGPEAPGEEGRWTPCLLAALLQQSALALAQPSSAADYLASRRDNCGGGGPPGRPLEERTPPSDVSFPPQKTLLALHETRGPQYSSEEEPGIADV